MHDPEPQNLPSVPGTCRKCAHFLDDAAAFERALPGILILSSGQGDTRGDQGLCRLHDRMLAPEMTCRSFRAHPNAFSSRQS